MRFHDRLEKITLANSKVSTEALGNLTKGCGAGLKSISLSKAEGVDNEGIAEIAKRCAQLRELDCSDCAPVMILQRTSVD